MMIVAKQRISARDMPNGPPLHSYQLFYVYQNISKGIKVVENTRMCLRTEAILIVLSPEPLVGG